MLFLSMFLFSCLSISAAHHNEDFDIQAFGSRHQMIADDIDWSHGDIEELWAQCELLYESFLRAHTPVRAHTPEVNLSHDDIIVGTPLSQKVSKLIMTPAEDLQTPKTPMLPGDSEVEGDTSISEGCTTPLYSYKYAQIHQDQFNINGNIDDLLDDLSSIDSSSPLDIFGEIMDESAEESNSIMTPNASDVFGGDDECPFDGLQLEESPKRFTGLERGLSTDMIQKDFSEWTQTPKKAASTAVAGEASLRKRNHDDWLSFFPTPQAKRVKTISNSPIKGLEKKVVSFTAEDKDFADDCLV